jgi:uncharacterized protein
VESDGTYHAPDILKSAYEGATSTGMNVWQHEIREAESIPLVAATGSKTVTATSECLACPIFSVCGGGLLAHRYSIADGFDRPSVYCDDIQLIVNHIRGRLSQELSPSPDLASQVGNSSYLANPFANS